ncbi:unnamed protein product, partial [Prorocentrum cordatum]
APPVAAAAPAPPAAAALGVPRRREAAEAVAPRRARLACPPAGRERAGAPRALPRLAGGRGAAAGCAEGARPARPQIRMCVFRPRRFSGVGVVPIVAPRGGGRDRGKESGA